MDEPLSNLDAKLRVQMRTEIAKLHNRIGTTSIYVTHDQTEAMTMADRIVVLKDGKVQQIDSPQQMYDHPDNVFVAGFIGRPAMNFLRARLEKENGGHKVVFGSTRMPMSREVVEEVKERRGQDLGEHVGEIVLGIRPEHMEDAETEAAEAMGGRKARTPMDVEPQVIESMGSEKYIYFEPPREQAAHLSSVAEMTEDDEGGAEQDTMGGSAEDVGGNLMVAVSRRRARRVRARRCAWWSTRARYGSSIWRPNRRSCREMERLRRMRTQVGVRVQESNVLCRRRKG